MTLVEETPKALQSVYSEDQLKLLDTIDKLRSEGIDHIVSLPQIIVCGDQSSGKSSVLEAISGVPFPVKSNACTRFPTELVLRKAPYNSANVSIVPHHSRSAIERLSMARFNESLDGFDGLPALIESATSAMGITDSGKAFSNDLLHIEISGPDRPRLTIVDLPGLVHSENKYQSVSDVALIKDIVQGYMKEPRSIILAVISAKNDYANQIVLQLARQADPEGHRTLGVITKPDTLAPGSPSEEAYISLASNTDITFRLGWHVLRNTDSDVEKYSLEQRNTMEASFFSLGNWKTLPYNCLGIQRLRARLSKVLLHQIASELPNLVSEISEKSAQCKIELKQLGEPRTTAEQQRTYLIMASQAFQTIVKAAVDGTYNGSFFGDPISESGYRRRIRAVIQNMSQDFASQLAKNGKKTPIVSNSVDETGAVPPRDTRAKLVDKVVKIMSRSRGRELPGMFNPMIVTDLFKEQSSPWEGMTEAHAHRAWMAAKDLLEDVVHHIADECGSQGIWEHIVMPKLEALLEELMGLVESLLKPYKDGHPITYNHYFEETLQKLRVDRLTSLFGSVLDNFLRSSNSVVRNWSQGSYSGQGDLVQQLVKGVEPGMALFTASKPSMVHIAASEAVDYTEAYYNVVMQRLIDDVAVEIIETGLVLELGKIIDPVTVSLMSPEDITKIAGENEESRIARVRLENTLKILMGGAEICKKAAGFRLFAPSDSGDEAQPFETPDTLATEDDDLYR